MPGLGLRYLGKGGIWSYLMCCITVQLIIWDTALRNRLISSLRPQERNESTNERKRTDRSSGVHQGWERICLGHIKACLKIVDSDSRLPANSTLGSLAHAWNKGSMGTRMGSTSGKNRQNSRGRHCLDSLGSSDLTQEKVESSVTLHGLARSQASLG